MKRPAARAMVFCALLAPTGLTTPASAQGSDPNPSPVNHNVDPNGVDEATGEVGAKPVTDLIRPAPKPLYALALRDAGGEAELFHATDDHPWKVEGKGWVATLDLREGDRIDTASGADMIVTSLTITDRVEAAYNLTVGDWHSFLVGEDRAVVHNACKFGGSGAYRRYFVRFSSRKRAADAARSQSAQGPAAHRTFQPESRGATFPRG